MSEEIDYKLAYEKLRKETEEMLDAQQAYFKSNKDFHLLKISKSKEKKVRELINPKPNNNLSFEFLAQ